MAGRPCTGLAVAHSIMLGRDAYHEWRPKSNKRRLGEAPEAERAAALKLRRVREAVGAAPAPNGRGSSRREKQEWRPHKE